MLQQMQSTFVFALDDCECGAAGLLWTELLRNLNREKKGAISLDGPAVQKPTACV
jgi:hypothetical protein